MMRTTLRRGQKDIKPDDPEQADRIKRTEGNILIVDDDPEIVFLIQNILKKKPFHVMGAFSGREAVDRVRAEPVDLMILDIFMPDISGLELMRHIRGTREDIEFIVMTGFPSIDAAIDALRTYRAYDFITKPIDNIRTFIKTIDQALERRRLRVEKQALIDRLRRTNETLQREVEERRQAEEALRKSQRMLEAESGRLARKNTALEVLLEKRQHDKADLERQMHFNARRVIQPHLDLLRDTRLTPRQRALIESIASNLDDIVSPLIPGLPVPYLGFTAKEIQIINQIKQGKSTKEIAELLHLSKRTIETHRNNIRQKLGIRHEKVNLRTYLLSLQSDSEY